MKLAIHAKIILTNPSTDDMSPDEKCDAILRVEQKLNSVGLVEIKDGTKIGIRVHTGLEMPAEATTLTFPNEQHADVVMSYCNDMEMEYKIL